MMAQSAGFDFDESVERRIRKAYGKVDGDTTVAEYLGLDGGDEGDDCYESAFFHVGIKWNEKEV